MGLMYKPRKRGMGGVTCIKSDAAGNCTMVRDTASDVTVDVTSDGSSYRYTDTGKAITFGDSGFLEWLNKNAVLVAAGVGGFFLLTAMTRR